MAYEIPGMWTYSFVLELTKEDLFKARALDVEPIVNHMKEGEGFRSVSEFVRALLTLVEAIEGEEGPWPNPT